MRYIFCLILSFLPFLCFAQTENKEDVWQDIYNTLSDLDDFDEEGWNEAYDILTSLAQSPQNINEATYADLQQIPLLNDNQALAILNYRQLYGDLHSTAEFYLITALDRPRCMLLSTIFYAEPTKKKDSNYVRQILTDSLGKAFTDSLPQQYRHSRWRHYIGEQKHSILLTANIPTYKREGDKDGTYRGYQYNHSLRYRFQSHRLQAAFTAAQDAGEPFFSGTNKKGWDFYTGYLRLKNIGILKNIVFGRYQVSLGMGLLLNNDFRLSKASWIIATPSSTATLRGHSSRQQSSYLQGIASTIAIPIGKNANSLSITPFVSYRNLDATLSDSEPRTITTILTSGYHRTTSEIERRNNAQQFAAGASVALNLLPFRVALNVLHVSLSDSLSPNKNHTYNHYRPTGKSFTSGSLTYGYINPRFQVSGESAISKAANYKVDEGNSLAFATANSLRYKVSSSLTAFAIQRYYSYRFQSLLGKSFGDMSNCQNESGMYFGATTTPTKHLSLSAYIDCVYHPWARYGYDKASRSWDTYLLATYTQGNTTASLRYRYREQAATDEATILPAFTGDIDGTAQHTLRFSLKHTCHQWTLISQVQCTYLPSSTDWGYLASEAIGYSQKRLSLWASLTYFDTSDYASRLYLTDKSLTYGGTLSMLYGRGLRANIIAQSQLSKSMVLALRCNSLHYFDRSQISSGHQLIDSSHQTDISLQLQYKF